MCALVSGGCVGSPEGPERSGGAAKRLDATQPPDALTNLLWFPRRLFATYARIYAAINTPAPACCDLPEGRERRWSEGTGAGTHEERRHPCRRSFEGRLDACLTDHQAADCTPTSPTP